MNGGETAKKEKSNGSKIKMPDLDAAAKREEIDSGRQEGRENTECVG